MLVLFFLTQQSQNTAHGGFLLQMDGNAALDVSFVVN